MEVEVGVEVRDASYRVVESVVTYHGMLRWVKLCGQDVLLDSHDTVICIPDDEPWTVARKTVD